VDECIFSIVNLFVGNKYLNCGRYLPAMLLYRCLMIRKAVLHSSCVCVTSLKLSVMPTTKKKSSEKDPCWDGYKQVGEKKKGGKEVPNCVPEKKGKK
jgi:hypothetical protein